MYFHCSMMWGIRFCGYGRGGAPLRGFLYLLWHETHSGDFPTRPEEDEKKGPRAFNRRKELGTVRKRRRSEKGNCELRVGTCGLRSQVSQCERMSQCSCWLCGNFAPIHASNSHRYIENHRKVSNTSFLHLELTQVHTCFFFFSSTLSVVYAVSCVFVKRCEMPSAADERNHYTIGWP